MFLFLLGLRVRSTDWPSRVTVVGNTGDRYRIFRRGVVRNDPHVRRRMIEISSLSVKRDYCCTREQCLLSYVLNFTSTRAG